MNERIKPDYSVPLSISNGENDYALDPRFDFIRVFPWLGYGIINVVTEEGVARLYVDQAQCERVHEGSGIPLVELEWISQSEHENMMDVLANSLDDSWLEGDGEHPLG